jgi:hypothetical protein
MKYLIYRKVIAINFLHVIRTWNYWLCLSLFWTFFLSSTAFSHEEILESEALSIQKITQIVERTIRSEADGSAHRGAHLKTHGCVKARFRILSLPQEISSGIFAQVREYPAWIRYSNGSGKIQDDSVGDGRGMAIKLMGVEESESGTQDFVMINHPVFFVRNATDYLEFQQALAQDSPMKFFFPDTNPLNFRLHELAIAFAIRSRKVDNPLNIQYWSATPYRLGKTAMKFSARPCDQTLPFPSIKSTAPNFLSENMQKHLDEKEACFDFMVQLRKPSLEMPIEDPTIEWKEKDSSFIPVAKITIPSQQFNTPEQLKFCEDLHFTPWHTMSDHQPLGGINRVRKTVYQTSSRIRHEHQSIKYLEPTGF